MLQCDNRDIAWATCMADFDISRSPFLASEEIRLLVEVAFVALEVGEALYAEGIFSSLHRMCPQEWSFLFGISLSWLSQQRAEEVVFLFNKNAELCRAHDPLCLIWALALRDCGYWQDSHKKFQTLSQTTQQCDIRTLISLFHG